MLPLSFIQYFTSSYKLNIYIYIYIYIKYCNINVFGSFDLFVIYISERKPCNNQRPRCDIEWLHVTNHLYHVSCSIVNSENVVYILQRTFSNDFGFI